MAIKESPSASIAAEESQIAKAVLMPGDPLRSKFIAENFLTELKLVNNIRGVQGYTGLYKGIPVSVMASGMGMPSIGIYSYELYTQYDVENIIRVGSAGALRADLELGSVVAGQGCKGGKLRRAVVQRHARMVLRGRMREVNDIVVFAAHALCPPIWPLRSRAVAPSK